MKKRYWDIIVILVLGVILVILSETDNTDVLIKLPFVTVYGAYVVGRLVGSLNKA